jgi:hypothetical protein
MHIVLREGARKDWSGESRSRCHSDKRTSRITLSCDGIKVRRGSGVDSTIQ